MPSSTARSQRLAEIVDIVRRTGALDATREPRRSSKPTRRADCLRVLPQSAAREALLELCVRSVERSS